MERLDALKQEDPDIKGMAFFHMPLREMKEAYEKMKLGDKSVVYRHGSIAEKDEYWGISKYRGTLFDRAAENGVIKWMFCGHDHLNTLSLVYKGIQMTYGMSVDYLGYKGIRKSYIQRGGTLYYKECGRERGCCDGADRSGGINASQRGKRNYIKLNWRAYFGQFFWTIPNFPLP